MTRLTSVHGSFAAHVVAARLQDEGFDVELRGAVHSPYGLTVGDMARVDLYVPADQVEEASYVLLVGEVDATLDDPPPEPAPRRASWTTLVAIATLGLIVVGPLALRLLGAGD